MICGNITNSLVTQKLPDNSVVAQAVECKSPIQWPGIRDSTKHCHQCPLTTTDSVVAEGGKGALT